MTSAARTLLLGLVLVMLAGVERAGATPEIALELVAGGLVHPLTLASPPGDPRRMVLEQIGRVRVIMPDGTLLERPFLDLRERVISLDPVFDERGLLGLAFDPDYARTGRLYVHYSAPLRPGADPGLDHTARISEFHVDPDDPDRADPASERVVLEVDQPDNRHNGGALAFGPDGYLYVAFGNGGIDYDSGPEQGFSQQPDSLLGKILRLDVSAQPYRVPEDNPFVGDALYRPEIWALGLRNPFRCSFDAAGTGALLCGDVGEGSYEEINLIRKGGNYGWRVLEGSYCFNIEALLTPLSGCPEDGLIEPVIGYVNCTFADACKGRAVIGGYVYRGSAIPELQGQYVFGDWAAEMDGLGPPLYAAAPAAANGAPWALAPLEIVEPRFHSYVLGFGQDAENELYLLASDSVGPNASTARGKVYKIVPATGAPETKDEQPVQPVSAPPSVHEPGALDQARRRPAT